MAKRQTVNIYQPPKRLTGYARVSTDDQIHDAQIDELRAAGCDRIYQDHGSNASRARPVLTRMLGEITAGEGGVPIAERLVAAAKIASCVSGAK
ncbi:resolvase/recombinase domain-containing protein (plasmid) [Rhizobium etli]|uniref:Resolvase/recombinase domain-containing protein n=1 Tax=Rhizobium etli TaxID=29449 RepID=A0AAN1BKU8_RHIET|nr:resolvase/recombinase domain-containing protein [Rhizobium etli]